MIHDFDDHGGMNTWGYGSMALAFLILAVILAAIRYHRAGDRRPADPPIAGGHRAARPPHPERVLAERYARGEIGVDEYRRRLRTLREVETDSRGRNEERRAR